ncbi:MAG: hypothetical protein FWF80_08990 [Defluviitaleaceae bacterium]|nr:hypothetical protein [Defluviitaleaceae bacterium]
MDYKKVLTWITIIFVGVLLFMTFFSRTLADMHVPRITLDFARQGTISPEARSSGIVRAADTEQIFAPVAGRITQIVAIGDDINAQTVLFTISSDLRTLADMLEQTEHNRRLNTLDVRRTQAEIASEHIQLAQAIAAPLALPIEPSQNLFEYDLQIENNERALTLQLDVHNRAAENAQDELAVLQTLFAEGIISQQELTDGENEVARLAQSREQILAQHEQAREQAILRREQAILNYEAARLAHEESARSAMRNHEAQIEGRRSRIAQLEFTLTAHEIESERIDAQILELTEQIAAGGMVEVRLGEGGGRTVAEVDVVVGTHISEGAAVLLTAMNNGRFYIDASFSQMQDFISAGHRADIIVGTERIEGSVTRIVPQGGRNAVTIEVQSRTLRGGEAATVTVSGGTSNHAHVIPLSALREDQNGYFVLYVEALPRNFGRNDYYLRVRRVESGRRDASHIAISSVWGMDIPEEPVVVNSDIPVRAGERVRIVGDGEFEQTR